MKNKTPRSPLSCSRLEDRQLLACPAGFHAKSFIGTLTSGTLTTGTATCNFSDSGALAGDTITTTYQPEILPGSSGYGILKITANIEANPSGSYCKAVVTSDPFLLIDQTICVRPFPGASSIPLSFVPNSPATAGVPTLPATSATFSIDFTKVNLYFEDHGSTSVTTFIPPLGISSNSGIQLMSTAVNPAGAFFVSVGGGTASQDFTSGFDVSFAQNPCRDFTCLNLAEQNIIEDTTRTIIEGEIGSI